MLLVTHSDFLNPFQGSVMEQLSRSNSNSSLHLDPHTDKNENQEQATLKIQRAFRRFLGDTSRKPKVFQAEDHNINLLVDAKELGNQELIPDRAEPVQTTHRINKTALLLILGIMLTVATKRRYGTLSPRGIWKQIRQAPKVSQQKV